MGHSLEWFGTVLASNRFLPGWSDHANRQTSFPGHGSDGGPRRTAAIVAFRADTPGEVPSSQSCRTELAAAGDQPRRALATNREGTGVDARCRIEGAADRGRKLARVF